MRSTTAELNRQMLDRADSYATADITFADGTKRSLGKDDFFQDNTVVESAETSSFPLGVVIPKSVTLSLVNDDDRWRKYAFDRAKVHVWTNFVMDDGTIKRYDLGTYTVIKPESYGATVTLSAVDDCYKLDKPYTSSLVFPVTAAVAAKDAADTCGITLDTTDFKNNGYLIKQKPEGVTFRTFFGDVAMLAGGVAKFDATNHLVIIGYSLDIFGDGNLNGGVFDSAKPYDSGDAADGGSFNPWNKGYQFDAGTAANLSKIHALHDWQDLAIEADDVVITGVRLVGQDDKQYSSVVSESYVLDVTSCIAVGNEQALVNKIAAEVVGFRFRPFSGNYISYPLAEAMDLANVIDRAGNVYQTVLTDVTYSFSGSTVMKCAADPPIRNSSAYSSSEARAVVKARAQMQSDMQQVISPIEASTLSLSNLISQGLGLYVTEQKNDDGSRIYYLHDEKTVTASKNLWRISGNVFSVSSDGGKTWKAGIDSNGNVLANVLSVVGLNFSWAHGGILTLGGANNASGQLRVLDDESTLIGAWNRSGIATKGALINQGSSGAMTALAGGKIAVYKRGTTALSEEITDSVLDRTSNWMTITPVLMNRADWSLPTSSEQESINGVAFGSGLNFISFGYYKADTSTSPLQEGIPKLVRNSNPYYDSAPGTVAPLITLNPSRQSLVYNFVPITMHASMEMDGYIKFGTNDYLDNSYLGIQWKQYSKYGGQLSIGSERNGSAGEDNLVINGGTLQIPGGVNISNGLTVHGGKSRAVKTEHYGTVRMNAFETASAHFADVGSGAIGDDGQVSIYFDPVFEETIEADIGYQVLVTRTSELGIDWVEKERGVFIVHGEKGATFDWMLIALQKGYISERMSPTDDLPIRTDGFDVSSMVSNDTSIVDVLDMVNRYEGGLATV